MPSNEEADHSAASNCIVENPHIDLGRNPFSSTTKVLFPSGSRRKDEREARLWRAGGRYCQHDVTDGCVETASAWGYNGRDLSRKLLRAEEQEGEVVTSRCSSMPRWRHYSRRCWRGLHPPRLFFSPQRSFAERHDGADLVKDGFAPSVHKRPRFLWAVEGLSCPHLAFCGRTAARDLSEASADES